MALTSSIRRSVEAVAGAQADRARRAVEAVDDVAVQRAEEMVAADLVFLIGEVATRQLQSQLVVGRGPGDARVDQRVRVVLVDEWIREFEHVVRVAVRAGQRREQRAPAVRQRLRVVQRQVAVPLRRVLEHVGQIDRHREGRRRRAGSAMTWERSRTSSNSASVQPTP